MADKGEKKCIISVLSLPTEVVQVTHPRPTNEEVIINEDHNRDRPNTLDACHKDPLPIGG